MISSLLLTPPTGLYIREGLDRLPVMCDRCEYCLMEDNSPTACGAFGKRNSTVREGVQVSFYFTTMIEMPDT